MGGILGKLLDKLFMKRALEKDVEGELKKLRSILEITEVELDNSA